MARLARACEAVSLRVRQEPVLTVGPFRAAITMLVGFGLGWSGEQVALLVAFIEAVAAWVARRQHREAHPGRPGELAADHPVPLVLGGEPLPARPGVLCANCNARKGLSERRR